MAAVKTTAGSGSVVAFVDGIADPDRRADAKAILALMKKATGERAEMWGSGIVGFGRYHYRYDSGREGESMLVGFAPRKSETVLYLKAGFTEGDARVKKLGRVKAGKGCLYVKRLADVDRELLATLIAECAEAARAAHQAATSDDA